MDAEPLIRSGIPEDSEFIISLLACHARSGHFSTAYLEEGGQREFAEALKRVFAQNVLSRLTYRGIEIVPAKLCICEIDQRPAGFFLSAGIDNLGKAERELYMLAIHPDHLGKNLGSLLTDTFCAHYADHTLHALCYPASERMFGMLCRRGFLHFANNNAGNRMLKREFPRIL
jgi:hypothetical protein